MCPKFLIKCRKRGHVHWFATFSSTSPQSLLSRLESTLFCFWKKMLHLIEWLDHESLKLHTTARHFLMNWEAIFNLLVVFPKVPTRVTKTHCSPLCSQTAQRVPWCSKLTYMCKIGRLPFDKISGQQIID